MPYLILTKWNIKCYHERKQLKKIKGDRALRQHMQHVAQYRRKNCFKTTFFFVSFRKSLFIFLLSFQYVACFTLHVDAGMHTNASCFNMPLDRVFEHKWIVNYWMPYKITQQLCSFSLCQFSKSCAILTWEIVKAIFFRILLC